jgi:hypothetical protein
MKDQVRIEDQVKCFFEPLLAGILDKNGKDSSVTFQSVEAGGDFLESLARLTEVAKEWLEEKVTVEELGDIVKKCPDHKSPSPDRLPYELYQKLFAIIGHKSRSTGYL